MPVGDAGRKRDLGGETLRSDVNPIAWVVMEAGAPWTTDLGTLTDDRNLDVVLEVQGPDEDVRQFSSRATERLQTLDSAGGFLVTSALLLSNRGGPEWVRMRTGLARLAVSCMRSGGELLLVAGEDAEASLRHELLGLAGNLCGGAPGTDLNVRVQFRPSFA